MTLVKLNIALHDGINPPADHDDEDELVQATNLWFDADIEASDLLDAIDGGLEALSLLFGQCYDEATRYYRIWDNYKPGEHWEDVTHLKDDEFTPDDALFYHEWHADVDWDNGCHYSILGDSFAPQEIASDKLITYLTELAGAN